MLLPSFSNVLDHYELTTFDNDFDITACNQLGDYSVVLLYLQKSLEIMQIDLPQDHPNLALFYNNNSEVCV